MSISIPPSRTRRPGRPRRNAPTQPESIRSAARIAATAADMEVLFIPRASFNTTESEMLSAVQGRVPPPRILTSETLRYMAERSKTVSSIIRRRSEQVAQFARRPMFDGDTGFEIVLKERRKTPTPAEAFEARRIEEILMKTGSFYNPRRRDNLRVAMQKLLYSTYVYDAMVVEPVLDHKGKLSEFFVIDGGSISFAEPSTYKAVTEAGKLSGPIYFVQTRKEQVLAEWGPDQLIYAIRNPSPVPDRHQYGQPELEMLVDVITIEIMVLTWGKNLLENSSVPDGMILIESNRQDATPVLSQMGSQQGMEDQIRKARAEMTGAQNAGRLAMIKIPRGSKGVFYDTSSKNKDMPFTNLYELAQNIIAAHYIMSPAELDIMRGTMDKPSFVSGDATATQVRQSRLNGLLSVLAAMTDGVFTPLIDRLNYDYTIQFRGVDHVAEMERATLEALLAKTGHLTFDDLRALWNLPEYKTWWSKLPNNPAVINAEARARGVADGGTFSGTLDSNPGISGQPNSGIDGESSSDTQEDSVTP